MAEKMLPPEAPSYGDLLKEIERLRKRNALLEDVAVAAEKEHDAGRHISKHSSGVSWGKWVKACDEHHDALNKLREVYDE